VTEVREDGSVKYRYTYAQASNLKEVKEGAQTRS
jgi:YD repeat-containing protein